MEQRQNIVIQAGGDPRQLPEFEAIRQEINKVNHPAQPEVNWTLIESLALTLFRRNGVDLQTAIYYILARTRLTGLAGFTEGCELLAGAITAQWESCWPQSETARLEILDWFTVKSGNALRALSFSEKDLRLLYRAERALQLIGDKLQQVPLRRVPKVENLLIFVQNIGRRIEHEKQQGRRASQGAPTETLLWMPGAEKPSVLTTMAGDPDTAKPLNASPSVTVNKTAGGCKARWRFQGFSAGLCCSLVAAACAYYFYVMPLQQQIHQLAQQPLGAALLWLEQPKIETYSEQLNRLAAVQSLSLPALGESSVAMAQQRWPQDKRQQTATARWQERMMLASESAIADGGYSEVRQRLEKLSNELLEQERVRGGLTISYLKTAIYQMQSIMAADTPLEALLKQLDEALQKESQAPAGLLKQIDDRWDRLNNRYYLLMRPTATQEKQP